MAVVDMIVAGFAIGSFEVGVMTISSMAIGGMTIRGMDVEGIAVGGMTVGDWTNGGLTGACENVFWVTRAVVLRSKDRQGPVPRSRAVLVRYIGRARRRIRWFASISHGVVDLCLLVTRCTDVRP
jgi:hypothetical protein